MAGQHHPSMLLLANLNFSHGYFFFELLQVLMKNVQSTSLDSWIFIPSFPNEKHCLSHPGIAPNIWNLVFGQEGMSATSYQHVLIAIQHAAYRAASPEGGIRGLEPWGPLQRPIPVSPRDKNSTGHSSFHQDRETCAGLPHCLTIYALCWTRQGIEDVAWPSKPSRGDKT